jgi:hypothetical protein
VGWGGDDCSLRGFGLEKGKWFCGLFIFKKMDILRYV